MKYINLIEQIPASDRKAMETYIKNFGCNSNFIGLDAWLENWSHSNQKLFRLLGNNLIKKYPYYRLKTDDEKYADMDKFVYRSDFKWNYRHFYFDFIKCQDMDDATKSFFNHLMDTKNFTNNKIEIGIKYKKPNGKKMLQIQAGAKPLKAIYRVIEYFKDDYQWDTEAFENFQKEFGIICSDNKIEGDLCISIHPLDYITMSDNKSNWQSCMSWRDDGCYHVGTIEMMNSNNVLCCYLTNNHTPFVFDENTTDPTTGELVGVWNNKKWRELFYFTKDIIMGGKPYPYDAKDLTITLLDKIKELAEENLGYKYQFGPELYKDMIYVDTEHRMQNQKMWARTRSPKNNIIWDTKGMYNDMLNDNDRDYWCYRNKVEHTKVISVSGKANCLCCNNQIIKFMDDEYEYNDRYRYVGQHICEKCLDTYFKCDSCGSTDPLKHLYFTKDGTVICKNCIERYYICPCCGKPFHFNGAKDNYLTYLHHDVIYDEMIKDKNKDYSEEMSKRQICRRVHWSEEDWAEELKYFEDKEYTMDFDRLVVCPDCRKKVEIELQPHAIFIGTYTQHYFWSDDIHEEIYILPPDIAAPYRMMNLKHASLEEIGVVDEEKKAS